MLSLNTLYQKIGYRFQKKQLIEDALSHRSFRGDKNNERLEFLGDAVLNLVISTALFRKCPLAREGELSRLRASLVRAETLALLAQELDLGRYLRLGAGELKAGGSQRNSILTDALEAVVGAIYLDAGLETCESCILQWYGERLENLADLPDLRDAKTRLQEYLQAYKLPLPQYEVLSVEGAAHQQTFRVLCRIEGLPQTAIGEGSSRRRAEQESAKRILILLGQ